MTAKCSENKYVLHAQDAVHDCFIQLAFWSQKSVNIEKFFIFYVTFLCVSLHFKWVLLVQLLIKNKQHGSGLIYIASLGFFFLHRVMLASCAGLLQANWYLNSSQGISLNTFTSYYCQLFVGVELQYIHKSWRVPRPYWMGSFSFFLFWRLQTSHRVWRWNY